MRIIRLLALPVLVCAAVLSGMGHRNPPYAGIGRAQVLLYETRHMECAERSRLRADVASVVSGGAGASVLDRIDGEADRLSDAYGRWRDDLRGRAYAIGPYRVVPYGQGAAEAGDGVIRHEGDRIFGAHRSSEAGREFAARHGYVYVDGTCYGYVDTETYAIGGSYDAAHVTRNCGICLMTCAGDGEHVLFSHYEPLFTDDVPHRMPRRYDTSGRGDGRPQTARGMSVTVRDARMRQGAGRVGARAAAGAPPYNAR